MPLPAAHRLLVHFGKAAPGAAAEPVPASVAVPEEPMPEDPSEPKPVLAMSADVEIGGITSAEPEAPAGPMADFGAAEVLRWLEAVEGLTGAQQTAIKDMLMEDQMIGQDLLGWTERTLPRMLRGTGAAEAAPVLLAARDKHFADAALGPVAAPEPEPEALLTPVMPPDEYTCPISHELMVDPVFTASGQTYERESIATWLRTKQTDPISNARQPNKKLVPNIAMRKLINKWKETRPEHTG